MQLERVGSEVAQSAQTVVQRIIRPKSDSARPETTQFRSITRNTSLAVNATGAVATVVLLAWANGQFSSTIAMAVLGSLLAVFALWYVSCTQAALRDLGEEAEAAHNEQTRLSALNMQLAQQVEQAQRRGAEINERSMRRIGADLHDGPAQLLGLVLLKIEEIAPHLDGQQRATARETLDLVRRATAEALDEIRNTARGLILPDIEQVTLGTALELAIRSHEKRTKSVVKSEVGDLPSHVPLPITISLFRFAQEGLNNAFRHAAGQGQHVSARLDGGVVEVVVADSGPGFEPESMELRKDALGLAGLKQRLSSLGGQFQIISRPGSGTTLIARFPLTPKS